MVNEWEWEATASNTGSRGPLGMSKVRDGQWLME